MKTEMAGFLSPCGVYHWQILLKRAVDRYLKGTIFRSCRSGAAALQGWTLPSRHCWERDLLFLPNSPEIPGGQHARAQAHQISRSGALSVLFFFFASEVLNDFERELFRRWLMNASIPRCGDFSLLIMSMSSSEWST